MITPRTSLTHPLQIATLNTVTGGRIGMTFCPGKIDPNAMTGAWNRDLDVDLKTITQWGASVLVSLTEEEEHTLLGVPNIGKRAASQGLAWLHLPIQDVSIPDAPFETAWMTAGEKLRELLKDGGDVVVHCRGGLGRTGIIAARLLIELGELPHEALRLVRTVRPGAVETPQQERYVLDLPDVGHITSTRS